MATSVVGFIVVVGLAPVVSYCGGDMDSPLITSCHTDACKKARAHCEKACKTGFCAQAADRCREWSVDGCVSRCDQHTDISVLAP